MPVAPGVQALSCWAATGFKVKFMMDVAQIGKYVLTRESQTETGLYYYRARYYDPGAGRFLSEDPIEFSGGPTFIGMPIVVRSIFLIPLG